MKFQFTFKGMDNAGIRGGRVHGNVSGDSAENKQDTIQQRLKEMIREKTEKRFERVLRPDEGNATVMISREKNNRLLLEMTLKALGDTFMSSDKQVESVTNLDQLVDTVLTKVERQLLKKKEIHKDHGKSRAQNL